MGKCACDCKLSNVFFTFIAMFNAPLTMTNFVHWFILMTSFWLLGGLNLLLSFFFRMTCLKTSSVMYSTGEGLTSCKSCARETLHRVQSLPMHVIDVKDSLSLYFINDIYKLGIASLCLIKLRGNRHIFAIYSLNSSNYDANKTETERQRKKELARTIFFNAFEN